mmetsp:Transcript_23232/g.64496  ORF Transcript_23232/g.64496 Transcript_23232/m.64496 type:complete len:393 (+) Transcript_23232:188-1366(+)
MICSLSASAVGVGRASAATRLRCDVTLRLGKGSLAGRPKGLGRSVACRAAVKDEGHPASEKGTTPTQAADEATEEGTNGVPKSDQYSAEMQQKMGGSLAYKHEDGINFAYVLPDIIVGSCPQSPEDVDRLAEEGVGTIFCLQEDHDSRYFGFEISDIQAACEERGDIQHVRVPVGDFDPFSLRLNLPKAVALIHAAHMSHPTKSVYIHCTAGLGRAPGTALAYMYWMRGFELMEAHKKLMEVRPCHPKLEAIRAATCDVLYAGGRTECKISVYRYNPCQIVQIAGLDVGWSRLLDLQYDSAKKRFVLERSLLPGRYAYKFVWDGVWSYSADHPTYSDGDHTNNFLQVVGSSDPAELAARERITSANGTTTPEERDTIMQSISQQSELLSSST